MDRRAGFPWTWPPDQTVGPETAQPPPSEPRPSMETSPLSWNPQAARSRLPNLPRVLPFLRSQHDALLRLYEAEHDPMLVRAVDTVATDNSVFEFLTQARAWAHRHGWFCRRRCLSSLSSARLRPLVFHVVGRRCWSEHASDPLRLLALLIAVVHFFAVAVGSSSLLLAFGSWLCSPPWLVLSPSLFVRALFCTP